MTRRQGGFSLIEMAVAMLLIALLLGSVLVPLTTQIESRNYSETQRILDQAREALIGYAAANGYFPCPASTTSNGLEAAGTNHALAAANTCPATVWGGVTTYIGFLPAATLGFTPTDANGYAVDAWGLSPQNRIRYAVVGNVTVNGVTQPFTRVSGMKNATMASLAAATNLLYVCNSGTGVVAGTNCGTAVALASNVAVVIWSVGPNAATTGGTSVDELQNPNPTGGASSDRIFVSKTKSEGTGAEFDDVVTWIGLSSLFNRMIAAGQLP
jgi:prepilin-type N-terminal cleavage/methylation domain-containing protein